MCKTTTICVHCGHPNAHQPGPLCDECYEAALKECAEGHAQPSQGSYQRETFTPQMRVYSKGARRVGGNDGN